jgi:hypothetical protein
MRCNWAKHTIRVFAILVIVLLTIVAGAEFMIGSGVRNFGQTAQAHFPGKRVEALMAMVECETCSLRDRNHAIWALGQLGDTRALPVLEKYCTGAMCDHLKYPCQKTLKTALRHLRHEDNNRGESLLWHWMLPTED